MLKLKEKNNMEFMWVFTKIGIGVLVYKLGLDLMSTVLLPLNFISVLPEKYATVATIIQYVANMFASLVPFVAATAVTVLLLLIGRKRSFKCMYMSLRRPLEAPFMMCGAVAIDFLTAEITIMMVHFLNSNVQKNSTLGVGVGMSALEIILAVIATAVIPGIVEELFFRGVILTNLAPYGKGMAIVTSALLFGLMHRNPQQFLYTTLMGIALGFIYVKTNSIWICMITHFLNNLLAVMEQVWLYNGTVENMAIYTAIIRGGMLCLGIASIVILLIIRAAKKKKAPEEIGAFGRLHESELSYGEKTVTANARALMFFSPTVDIFTISVFGTMLMAVASYVLTGLLCGLFPELAKMLFGV